MEDIINTIKEGGVAVLPTDTLYGLHASVFNESAVSKIYDLKQRTSSKPLIILISSWEDLDKLNIQISDNVKAKLNKWWPGSLSVILPCNDSKLEYLHRGTNSLAIRWPDYPLLNNILKETGPLVSTTVNIEGEAAAESTEEAEKLFKDKVDKYLDDGPRSGTHSTLIRVDGDNIEVLREGAVKI
ncbi:threonylcarbamoyl-AMP synthase [Patescibacteria group bacterium]|nr:threonylcarbamoyl-AMP synthase [Patescibacteria group bacterium]